ncbi:T9SS sorting signal type C domain-containing protein [Flavobacterium sp. DGU38]|uniref:T9SS sorting signal type C domain-containing protein n=1 Tax=Flavobacterium calami TaxID=3139144 RepID=A0ABU9IT97_9FLAO
MIQKLLLFSVSLFTTLIQNKFSSTAKWFCLSFLMFQIGYGQTGCNVVKGGQFNSDTDLANWTLSTYWSRYGDEAYIDRDGANNVSLRQNVTGLLGNSLTLTFKIKGQNADRMNCGTSATLDIKIGGTTYMRITNPTFNNVIDVSDITLYNGATFTPTNFPITVGGNGTGPLGTKPGIAENALTQGTIILTIPSWTGGVTADIEFVASASSLLNGSGTGTCVATWGGDDWLIDDVSLTASDPTTYNVTGSNVCVGTTATIGLSGSQLGVSYQLQRNGVNIGSIVAGTGSLITSAAFGGGQTLPGIYTIVSIIGGRNCKLMNGSVAINAQPSAGADQTGALTCGVTTTTLAATAPTVGTGTWSIVSGTGGTVSDPSSPTSTFTGTAGISYTLRWTVSNSPCVTSSDDVIITFNQSPAVSITGSSYICAQSTTTLSPTTGGTWTSGNTSVATVTPAGVVTGVAIGSATLTFESSTAPNCKSSVVVNVSSGLSITYNASNTFTVPTGVTSLQVECWGGGGGGGGTNGTNSAGGGGAGGAYVRNTSISVLANNTYTVTVGAGGTVSTTGAGGSGGSSWFGSTGTILAVGGNGGGLASGNNSNGTGGAAVSTGNAGGTTSSLYGAPGISATGTATSRAAGNGGTGANGGTGGIGVAAEGVGAFGNPPGGGGAGGRRTSGGGSANRAGGAGGAGRVIITIAAPTATGTGSQTICQTGTATVSGISASNGTIAWTHNGAGSLSNETTSTPTYTPAAGDAGNTVTLTMTVSNGPCVTPATATYTVIVRATPTATISGATTVCQGVTAPNVTFTNPRSLPITVTYNINGGTNTTVNVAANTTATVAAPTGTSGTFTYNLVSAVYQTAPTCSASLTGSAVVTINSTPTTPTVGTITNISCTTNTGSVVLNDLPSSGNWSITSTPVTVTTTGSGNTTTISGLTSGSYTFTVTNASGCPSPASALVIISDFSSTTWNGSGWSHGLPDATKNLIIASSSGAPFASDLAGCALTVNNGITASVPSGVTLTITNAVTVSGSGSLTFENTASLVQINNISNSGAIVYKRNSAPMKNFDFTYWASPVAGQTLYNLSPNTLWDKYFSFSGTAWVQITNGAGTMQPGIGYIIRVPKPNSTYTNGKDYWTTSNYVQPVEFIGVPNNGNITSSQTMVAGNLYLIGNPYPCAMDADEFLYTNLHNRAILEGTIYFWTHNTAITPTGTQYKYASDDYASYNLTGGTGTSAGSAGNKTIPDGYIAAGQSFFATAKGAGNVEFNNSMRAGAYNNTFFKPGKTSKSTKLEKHRLWLNMINAGGAYKQALIGYVEGATNSFDLSFDGLSFDGNSYIDFYSVNAADNYVIQGRALPFTDTDLVPLGYRSTVAGDFTIAIDHADGNLATQRVYLEDKQTGMLNELTAGNYTFNTKAGTFNDRFVLKYANRTLGAGDFESVDNSVSVVAQNKTITINSAKDNLEKVLIYDLAGKQLYSKDNINNLQLIMHNLPFAQQVLLVKIIFDNGTVTTKKIVFK